MKLNMPTTDGQGRFRYTVTFVDGEWQVVHETMRDGEWAEVGTASATGGDDALILVAS